MPKLKIYNKNNSYSVSQNFLTSKKTIDRLIKIAKLGKNDLVLEIGAGKGHITKCLAEKAGKIIAYEIDGKLYSCFKQTAKTYKNLSLLHGDFLKCKLPQTDYKVLANIPFSLTTEIIKKLTCGKYSPCDMWLVMEKGAAKRFSGKPQESLQSLLLKPFFDTETVYYFKREDFHPAPSIAPVMLHISKKAGPDIMPEQRNLYVKFISHSLKYGLFGKNALLTKKQINTALRLENLPEIRPTGDVLYIQWLCLFRCWARAGAKIKI